MIKAFAYPIGEDQGSGAVITDLREGASFLYKLMRNTGWDGDREAVIADLISGKIIEYRRMRYSIVMLPNRAE